MQDPLAWYNLVYLIPLAIGVVAAFGAGLGHDAGGHDADHDHDLTDHNAGHSLGHDHDSEHNSKGLRQVDAVPVARVKQRQPLWRMVLSLLGMGKIPLSILLMMGPLLFGGTGFTINMLLDNLHPLLSFAISFPLATTVSIVLTSFLGSLIGRYMPALETANTTANDLIGSMGKLTLPTSDTNVGLAQVYDRYKRMHQVRCKTRIGALPKGGDILIVDYDETTAVYVVEQSELLLIS